MDGRPAISRQRAGHSNSTIPRTIRRDRVDIRGRRVHFLFLFLKLVEFHDPLWNHREKLIQVSTNIPGVGSVNREIAVILIK